MGHIESPEKDSYNYGECKYCGADEILIYRNTGNCVRCTLLLEILKELHLLERRMEGIIERINERR